MTTGRINQVAALKTGPARLAPSRAVHAALPGEWCFDLVWEQLRRPSGACVAPGEPGKRSPASRPVARVTRFQRGPLVGLPGVVFNQRSEALEKRVQSSTAPRPSAGCPVARAASRRAPLSRRAEKQPGSSLRFVLCYVCASRIRTSLPSARAARPKPAGACRRTANRFAAPALKPPLCAERAAAQAP